LFPGYITIAVMLQVCLTAYSGVVYLGAGTSVIGAGDSAILGIVGLCVAILYAISSIKTARRRWPAATFMIAAAGDAAWMIVVANKYGSSDRILAGIDVSLTMVVILFAVLTRNIRMSTWRTEGSDPR
jgi:hypothetical protein